MNSDKEKRNEEILKQKELYGIVPVRKDKKQAIAVAYTPGERAPKILATGTGELAEKIIEKGQINNIPLFEDGKLASTLSKLNIGDMIPPELYDVVAEILVFVDDMDRLKKKLNES